MVVCIFKVEFFKVSFKLLLNPDFWLMQVSTHPTIVEQMEAIFRPEINNKLMKTRLSFIQNFGYAIKQNRGMSRKFHSALKGALEHYFNNHNQCQESQSIFLQKNISNERKNSRDEQLHVEVKDYNAIKLIHNIFVTDKNNKMLHHRHNSQKMSPSR